MDESEKRRERLKSMRMEAAAAEVGNFAEAPRAPAGLSNPFTETPVPSQQPEPFSAQRFDFYTDPMAAFSADKRRNKAIGHAPQSYTRPPSSTYVPSNPQMAPPPVHFQNNYPQDARVYPLPYQYPSPGPYRGPMGRASPFPSHHGTAGTWNVSGHTSGYGFPQNLPRGDCFPIPGSGHVAIPGFSHGQARGQWLPRGPSPGRGRGRGGWSGNNMAPASGRSGGRGQRTNDYVSAQDNPEFFYNKSMVEDPWKRVEPVIWKGLHLNTIESLKSHYMKKPRIAEAPKQSQPQFNLAEYLAASFDEAVDASPKD